MKKSRKSRGAPSFARRLRAGEYLLGTIVICPAPEIVETLAGTGLDWLFIDCEHGVIDASHFVALMQAAGSCPCVVRIPGHDPAWIGRALDAGAAGIIAPRVNTAAQARAIVAAAKYPPRGTRGMGLSRAHGFGLRHADYLRHADAETAVIIQAESRTAVKNIAAIAAVPGIDAIFIGPNDLAASLGHLGNVDALPVVRAIDRIMSTCRRADKHVGYFSVTTAGMRHALASGATLAAVSCETLLLIGAVRAMRDEMNALRRR
jgi:2-dehydro-3-deoxyglucarate aldolase/4-hydroxy-2-oxoheptanedioate aldolase